MKKLWIGLTLLAVLLLAFTGMAGADEPIISLNTPTMVEIAIPGDVAVYEFTPAEDGLYRFYSVSADEDNWYYTYGYLLDEDMQMITSNVNGGGNYQFQIIRQLSKDKTYYFGATFLDYDMIGSYPIMLEKIEGIYATAKRSRVYAKLNYPGKAEVEAFSSNGGLTYQWYDGETAIADATEKAYNFQALTEAKTYKCIITDAAGRTAEVLVDARIDSGVKVSGTGDGLVEFNGNAMLSINATAEYGADHLTYSWYEEKQDNNGEWYSDLFEGATSPTLELSGITHNRSFFCRVSDINGDNHEYWFRVYLPGEITFTASSDTETTVAAGSGLTLSATAVSENDYPVSYRWYREVINDYHVNRLPIDGANSSTCTVEHVYTGSTFICEATNSVGNTSYKYFTVNVTSSFTAEADGESNVSLTPAETTTLKVIVSNDVGPVAYQWFYYNNTFERYVPVRGATASSYPVSGNSKAGAYYCLATDTATDTAARIQFETTIVNHFSAGTVGDTELSLNADQTAELKVQANTDGGNVFYRWYKSEYNTQYDYYEEREIIEDERTDTLTITARNRCQYYCVVFDQYGNTDNICFNVRIRNGFSVDLIQSSYIVNGGEGVTISATGTCTNGEITYRWQRFEESYGYYDVKVSSESFLTIDAVGTGNIGEYKLYAYDQYGNSNSVWFRISIENNLSVTAIGDSQRYVDPGADVTLAVEASCNIGDLSYQWYQQTWDNNTPDNWYYTPMESKTQNTLQLVNIQESKYYYCQVKDAFGGERMVFFQIKISNGLSAYAEDSGVYVAPNASATMRVIASCKSGDLSYQWYKQSQYNDENGRPNWDIEIIPGAINATYTIDEANQAGDYLCRVKDTYGSITEVWFSLHIENGFNAYAKNHQNIITVAPGGTAIMEVSAVCETGALTYQWYRQVMYEYETGGGYGYEQLIEGENGSSCAVSELNKAGWYYCRVKDDYGNAVSIDFKICIENNLVAEALNNQNSYTIAPEETATMKVTASCNTGGLDYQWYHRVWCINEMGGYEYPEDTIIVGAKNDSYTITAEKVGAEEYYCRIKDEYDNETTVWFNIIIENEFEFHVLTGVEYGSRIWNVIVTPGETAQLAVNGSCKVGDLTYQWYEEIQYEENGVLKTREEIIGNATGDTYTTGAINERKTYYCVIADEYGDEIQLIFIVSIDNGFYAYAEPAESIYVHPGEPAVLNIAADCNNGELTYQWYQDLSYYDESGEWLEIYVPVENDSNTYTTGAIDETSHYICRVSDMYGNRESIRFDIYIDSGLTASAEGSNEIWVAEGDTATLKVTASSTYEVSISYRWEGYDNTTNTLVTEPVYGNSEYTCYVTDNYGNTVPVRFRVGVDRMGNLSSTPITAGQPATAVFGEGGSNYYHYFEFIPTETAYYRFYSQADGQITEGCIYNPGFEMLAEYHYNGVDNNFLIEYKFNAGHTYYLAARCINDNATGSFPVRVEIIEGLWTAIADTYEIYTDYNRSATLHVVTEQRNAELTYTWKKMPSGEIIDQAGGDTLTIDSVTQYGEYVCTVSDQYGKQKDAWFRVYVNNPGLVISYREQRPEVAIGEEATLQIIASGSGSDEVQYQWYNGRIDDVNLLEGETGATLTVTHEKWNEEYYSCVATDQYGNPYAFSFWVHTVNGFYANTDYNETTVNAGESTTLYVNAGCWNGSIHYQWYENEISEETMLAGQQNNSLTLENVQSRKTYYCRVNDDYGNVVDLGFLVKAGKENQLTANALNDQNNFTVEPGETVTLEVEASCTDGTLSYQWYRYFRQDNGDWTDEIIEGATEATYTTGTINDKVDYYCWVYDEYGNQSCVRFNIFVDSGLTAHAEGSNEIWVGAGETVTLTVAASNMYGSDNLSYYWEGSDNYTNSLTTDPIDEERYYTCHVTDEYENTVDVQFHVGVDQTAGLSINPITAGETVTVDITEAGVYHYFEFIPDETAYYQFYSEAVDEDTYGYIYNRGLVELTQNDDDGEEYNFLIEYKLNAGEKYILAARYYNSDKTGSFPVHFEIMDGLVSAYAYENDIYTDYNESATLQVLTEQHNAELAFTWRKMPSGEIIESASDDALTIDSVTQYGEYMCTVSDQYGRQINVEFRVYVSNTGLFISPEGSTDRSLTIGETTTLQINATGNGSDEVQYQWYRYRIADDCLLEGKTGATLTVTHENTSEELYYCRVTDQYGNKRDYQFRLYSVNGFYAYFPNGEEVLVETGNGITLNVYAFCNAGSTYYEWYKNELSEATKLADEQDSYLTLENVQQSNTYYCRVSDDYGNSVDLSILIKIRKENHLTANALSDQTSFTVEPGETVTMTVQASCDEGELSYQWYEHADNDSWEEIADATDAAYTTGPIIGYKQYLCRVDDQYGNTQQCQFYVHIDSGLAAMAVGSNEIWVGAGETVTLTVAASNMYGSDNLSYYWEGSDNYTNSLTTDPIDEERYYTCHVTDEYGNTVDVRFHVGVDRTAGLSINPITAGETATVDITEAGAYCYFEFIPDETAYYRFYSEAVDEDTYGYIYNRGMRILSDNDDGGQGNNFLIEYMLNAGQKYILAARYYNSDKTGSFPVHIEIMEGLISAYAYEYDVYTDYNESATLRVLTEQRNAELTYTWRKTPSGEIIEPASGDTLTIDSITQYGAYVCTVSDQNGKQIDVTFYVHVNNPGLVINTEGSTDRILAIGETTMLQINASGDGSDDVQYQWYRNTITDDYLMAGETGATLTITHGNRREEWYYCRVTDEYGNIYDYGFHIYSFNGFHAYFESGEEILVETEEGITLDVYAYCDEGSIHYEWYENEISEATKLADEQDSYLTLENVQQRSTYFCRVSDEYGNVVNLSILVKVRKENQLTAIPENNQEILTVEPGETVTMTVVASCSEGELSYHWYEYDEENNNWETITDVTGAVYTTGPIIRYKRYYCRVNDQYGNSQQCNFYVHPDNGLVADCVGRAQQYAELGTEITLEVDAACDVGGITYQWYGSTYDSENRCWASVAIIEGETESSLTVTINGSKQFRCSVHDEYNNYDEVYFEVYLDNKLTSRALGDTTVTVPYGQQAVLEATASCNIGGISYQWCDDQWFDIEGATYSSYTTPSITANDRYICKVRDEYGNSSFTEFYINYDSGLTAEPAGAYVFNANQEPITLAVNASSLIPDATISYEWWYGDYYGQLGITSDNTYELTEPMAGKYCCNVSDGYQTKTVWFYVGSDSDAPIAYYGNDSYYYVDPGKEITLKVIAWNAENDIQYQWFERTETGEDVVIDGATEANFTLIADHWKDVFCRVSGAGIQEELMFHIQIRNSYSIDYSNSGRILVVSNGGNAQLSINVTTRLDENPTYQWYRNGEAISGETSSTLIVTTGGDYHAIATDRFGNTYGGDTFWCVEGEPATVSAGQTVYGKETGRTIYQFVPDNTGYYQIESGGNCSIYLSDSRRELASFYNSTTTEGLEAGKTYYAVLYEAQDSFKYTLAQEEQTEYTFTVQPEQDLWLPPLHINNNSIGVNYLRSDNRSVVSTNGSWLYIRNAGTANVTVVYENGMRRIYHITVANGNTLTMPSQLQEIEEDAFNGDTSVRFIELGSNVYTVQSGAFANMGSICVIVENPNTVFENGVFTNSNPLVICDEWSNAASYCRDHGIPFLCWN